MNNNDVGAARLPNVNVHSINIGIRIQRHSLLTNRTIALFLLCIFTIALIPDVKAESFEIGLYAEPQQEIYGWGGFPSYFRTDWGAAFAPPIERPGVFKALFQDSGLSIFRVDYQPRFYNSAADDGSLNTTAIDDLITMVKGAGEFGVTDYLVSIWSPPACMKNTRTINGRDDDGNISSLLKYREEDYIEFICNVTDYIKSKGVPVPKFISLGNEPTYAVWYDSNVYTAEQYQRLCVMLRKALDRHGHTDVGVVAGEGNNYHYNYDLFGYNYDDYFLNQEFHDAVDTFAAHSYDSGNYSISDINQMRDLIRKIDKPFMQSEWCPDGVPFTGYSNVPLAVAIHVSRHFAREMADVGFNYWFWWMMWTENRGNMGLIGGDSPVDEGNNYKILSSVWTNAPKGSRVKKLYTTDPDLISTGASEIDMVGFSNAENNKTTILIVNPTEKSKDITLKYIPGKNITINQIDDNSAFREIGTQPLNSGQALVNFPARSVSVIVSDGATLDKNAPQPPPLPELEPLKDVEYFASSSILTVEAERVPLISIDGALSESEWDISKPIDKLVVGNTENQAAFGVLYDDKYLYVGAEVKDDAICDSESTAGHIKDSVEIYIDAGNEKSAAYDNNDFQLMATIVPNRVVGGRGLGDSCIMASKITDEGYTVEVAIPWASLNANPLTGGGVLGLDVGVNDNDDGVTRRGQIMWSGKNTNWTNTENFGECVLNGIKSDDDTAGSKLIFKGELKDAKPQLTRATTAAGISWDGGPALDITFKGPASALFRFNSPVVVTPAMRSQTALKFRLKAEAAAKLGIILTSDNDGLVSVSYYTAVESGGWTDISIPLDMFEDLGRNQTGALQKFNYSNITGVGFEATDFNILLDDLKIDVVYDRLLPTVNNLVSNVTTQSSIHLSWDKADGIQGYNLYRNQQQIQSFDAQTTEFKDEGLTGGRPYAYRLTTHDGKGGESRPSNYLIEKTVAGSSAKRDDMIAHYSKFYDDIRGYEWAIYYIDLMAEHNFIKGVHQYNGYMFKPDEFINRRDFSVAFSNIFGVEYDASGALKDITNVVSPAAEALRKFGIIDQSGRIILPDTLITRQDMCLVMAHVLELESINVVTLSDYSDISAIEDYAVSAVASMVDLGYIRGITDSVTGVKKLMPKDYVTRAETAVILGRIYESRPSIVSAVNVEVANE